MSLTAHRLGRGIALHDCMLARCLGWADTRPSWWEPRSPTTPRVEGSGRTVLACPTPSRKHSTNQPGTRAGPRPAAGGLHAWPTSLALSLAPGGLLACHGVHRPPVPRAGQTARPGNRKGHIMTEAAVSFAGNLTEDPELRHTEGGIARSMFRVAVSGRREQEASFFTVVVRHEA